MIFRLYSRATLIVAIASFVFIVRSGASSTGQDRPVDDERPLRLNATLVQVPAVVMDRNGKFVKDLSPTDFSLSEDGRRQDIALFAPINGPFNCVLVLDTSNTSEDRLPAIRNTAVTFASELAPGDRMMAVSFDNEVRELTEFTPDQEELKAAIREVQPGFGKLLYEAVRLALERLKNAEGRRAIVLFSDGIDMRSIEANAEDTIKLAEEIGAVIYCVKFDTRWWLEAEGRRREIENPTPRFPGHVDGRIPVPPDLGGPDQTEGGVPKARSPRVEVGNPNPPVVVDDGGTMRRMPAPGSNDQVTETLNRLYGEAEQYLQSLASRTGGRVLMAETLENARSAFGAIAEELRNQYLLGYYVATDRRDGKYRKIKLTVARKDVQVRARPGYRASSK